jgi:hypothetical protein
MTFEPDPNSFGPLGPIFYDFEKWSGWHLSMPAKHIIYQGFVSIEIDTLGVGEYTSLPARQVAFSKAISLLPEFLKTLLSEAEFQPIEAKAARTIGGIFVLQHADAWGKLFGCSCWPI